MDIPNFHFAEPEWLWLAILAPAALVALQIYAERARQKQVATFAAAELLEKLLASHSPFRRAIKNFLLFLTVAGMALAMARPQWGVTSEISQAFGEDVVFVVDCSRSMLARDVLPTRLGRAKNAVEDFVQKHGKGRVGLVAFAGEAFIQCPLTFDYDAFREAVRALDDRTIPVAGTDIGRALEEASHAMDTGERRKFMILITDGEDLEQSGIKTAETLAKKGVFICAVGVGTPKGGAIQFTNNNGAVEILRDSKGNIVESKLDESTLRSLAAATHGVYQPLGPLGEGLTHIRQYIEADPHSVEFTRARRSGVDRYYIPLAMVTFLLFLEPLLGTRRRPLTLVLIGLLALSQNNAFSQTAEEEPLSARELYNQGTKTLKAGKLADAEKSLQAAMETQDEKVMPHALYNLGETRFINGMAQLKKAGDGKSESDTSELAGHRADDAITSADAALANDEMQAIISAYMEGRGARKDLKSATSAVKEALEKYGNILKIWQRAAGDFDSASELNPSDNAAKTNAEVVRKYIAKLVDMQQMLQAAMDGMGQKRSELQKKLGQLKKKMGKNPGGEPPGGKNGDDDEDEDEGNRKKGPEGGADEQFQKEGKEMNLTMDEAQRLLGMLKLDANRRLGYGTNESKTHINRKGRDW